MTVDEAFVIQNLRFPSSGSGSQAKATLQASEMQHAGHREGFCLEAKV